MHILLCGVPGTGKTVFAKWLCSERSYVRRPTGTEPVGDFFGDVRAALRTHEDLVIDWGLPAFDPSFDPCLHFVISLISDGVSHWWFDGDRDAALRSFLAREDHPATKADWDRQLAGIQAHWSEIAAVFAGRTVEVIAPGPTYLAPETIFSRITAPTA